MGAMTEQRQIRVAIIGAGISGEFLSLAESIPEMKLTLLSFGFAGISQAIRLRERLDTKVQITVRRPPAVAVAVLVD
jgi:cation diffusion facilitator CzcD-associated flavoprotein CzcO